MATISHSQTISNFPDNGLRFYGAIAPASWHGSLEQVAFTSEAIQAKLLQLDRTCYVVSLNGQLGVTTEGHLSVHGEGRSPSFDAVATLAPFPVQQLGDPYFRAYHGVQYAYSTGAMSGGIASSDLVIALGQAGILGSFGAGGLTLPRIEESIQKIQKALPNGPYAFNLIHAPNEGALERGAVDLFLQYGVQTVEASAFLNLTPHIVRYRAAGLSLNSANQIVVGNKVIAKLSRQEVAAHFLKPAPLEMLKTLVQAGQITELQANLAQHVPMADDITVEADSGGHTDNRPLVCLLPSIVGLRDEMQLQHAFVNPVRIGAAGGIGTPQSALAAFMMGASYVVTGSVNQSCVESGTSDYVKQKLAEAGITDVMMAPAGDMFEMGVKLQVLKRGSLFATRAQRLYEVYRANDSIDTIPLHERTQLEKQVFRREMEDIWNSTKEFFSERDPDQVTRAEADPKRKMALIFRWYLGLSSRWASAGERDREMDYQIWCGPAMGAFNEWVKGSYLAQPENRRATDVAYHILTGAAFLYRLQSLKAQGVHLPLNYNHYHPTPIG